MTNFTFLACSNLRYRAPESKNLNLIYILLNHPSMTMFINCVYIHSRRTYMLNINILTCAKAEI